LRLIGARGRLCADGLVVDGVEALYLVGVDIVVPVVSVPFGECNLYEVNDGAGERAVFGYRLCADAVAQRRGEANR